MHPRRTFAANFILALLLLLFANSGNAAEQKATSTPSKPVASPPPPVTIPLPDIATRATEVANLLGSLIAAAAPDAQVEAIIKTLPNLSATLDADFAATTRSLEAEPTLETLQALQQQWQRHQTATSGLLNTLTQRATRLQDGFNQLAALQKTWSVTRVSAQAANAPGPILQQIDATLTAVATAHATLQTERTAVLNLQSRVAREVTKSGTALAQIARFQQKAVAGIFVPDARPIWRVESWPNALIALPEHARKVAGAYRTDIDRYLRQGRDGGALHAALFILFALAFCAAQRKIVAWNESGEPATPELSVFERPYAAAGAIVLIFATSPFFQLANSVRQVLTIIALAPVIRVARPMVGSSVATAIHALGILFLIDTLRQIFAGIQVVDQAVLVVETLAAIVVLIWLRRHYRQFVTERTESSRLILLRWLRVVLVTVFVVALLAGMTGYLRLARLLTPGIFVGGVLALVAIVFLRVVAGVLALVFRLWPLRQLQMVQHHRGHLARRVYVVLVWGAIFGWTIRYLVYLGLWDPTRELAQSVLFARIERGTISISLAGVLEFFLVVWLAYLLSGFLRFVLQEDIYPRIGLAPGLSYAVSSLLNYVVLALGFVAGLGVLGVDFTKVSILAGAFGIGIGFGLQSIVNNFVSGLILLFERPIHVGDMVQVADLQGRVLRIGIRASIIRTLHGAEIIVPNGQLITDRVTNWTLSDQLRRVDLPVGVNYGADPKIVIEMLERTAKAHSDVLPDPAPRALFMSYGDSSINFELRVWTEYRNWQQVHSDLTVALYDAVKAAPGISFPFPQRDVHILSDHAPQARVSPGTREEKKA